MNNEPIVPKTYKASESICFNEETGRVEKLHKPILSTVSPAPDIPPAFKVVGFSWNEFIEHPLTYLNAYFPNFITYLPMVYTDEEYEYRQYLESKIRLLEEELEIEMKLAKIRKSNNNQWREG